MAAAPRVEQLSLVRMVSGQIANVLDLDELFLRVADLILDTFRYYYVALFTVEPSPDDFDETDMLVLRALAHNVSIAVEDARLYGDLRRRADQLSTVAEVSRAVASILDLDVLLEEVVTLIHRRFGYPFVHLFACPSPFDKERCSRRDVIGRLYLVGFRTAPHPRFTQQTFPSSGIPGYVLSSSGKAPSAQSAGGPQRAGQMARLVDWLCGARSHRSHCRPLVVFGRSERGASPGYCVDSVYVG